MDTHSQGYVFSHRAFAEYLCAQSLLAESGGRCDAIPDIGRRVWDARWEAVVRYLVELSRSPACLLRKAVAELPKEWGTVESVWQSPNHPERPFVLILAGSVMNAGMRFREAQFLQVLVRRNLVGLVTAEAACGTIDTSWFRAFPDAEIRREVAAHFVRKLEITGPEYCQIALDVDFDFFGADDKDLYVQQLNALLKEKEKTGQLPAFQALVPGVYDLTTRRCRAMAENTVARMEHLGLTTAVLHVGRTFTFVIREAFEGMDISCAICEASAGEAEEGDDWSKYARVLTGKKDSLEEILMPSGDVSTGNPEANKGIESEE